jgi:flagellar capping protein FliD
MQQTKNLSVYNVNPEVILAKGLDAMTKSCEALTAQNERLNKDIENLKKKIDMLQDRLLSNAEERE